MPVSMKCLFISRLAPPQQHPLVMAYIYVLLFPSGLKTKDNCALETVAPTLCYTHTLCTIKRASYC